VTRIVTAATAAVLRELGHGSPDAVVPDHKWPEWMPDAKVRQAIIQVSRSKYWEITHRPDYPEGRRIGRRKFRNVQQVLRWVAENPDA